MKLRPLADNVVVDDPQADSGPAKTKSGFYLTENAAEMEKPMQGIVIAVGKDVKETKIGDEVLYTKYGPLAMEVEDRKVLFLKERDILAVIPKGKSDGK